MVHIGPETFQYVIIDHVQNQVKVLAEFELEQANNTTELIKAIEALPESKKQFKYSFNIVKISFDSFDYTFIPADLYVEEDRHDYSKFLSFAGTKEILVNNIPSVEIKNVVAIEPALKDALQRIFQNPKIYNQASPFLEGIQKSITREDDLVCFIDFQPSNFQFGIIKDFRLEFYNTFEYFNADEFNYYLLNIIESLALRVEQTPIVLSGKVSKTDEVYLRIEKYFERIRFIDSEHLTKYSGKFEEVLPHTFFTLFSLDLCE